MVSGYQLPNPAGRTALFVPDSWILDPGPIRVTPSGYVVGMETMTLVHTTHTQDLMALSNSKLEAWFDAGGLTVEVVANCGDPSCPDCVTVMPSREAA